MENLSDLMRLVAERRLYALTKKAAREEALAASQAARNRLGLLGTDEPTVNQAVRGFNRGELSRGQATGMIGRATPGSVTQFVNSPVAALQAASRGDVGEAAAQADVVGLKNLTRPLPLLAAGAAGVGGHALQQHVQQNRLYHDLLHGHGADAQKAMEGALSKEKYQLWDRWRRQSANMAPAEPTWKQWWNTTIRGPGKAVLQPGHPSGFGVQARPEISLGRHEFAAAAKNMPAPKTSPGLMRRMALPMAAASLPLMASEWLLPGGYRSGRVPARQLLDANKELRSQA